MVATRTNQLALGLWVMAVVVLFSQGCEQRRRPVRYLIPDGYVGEVTVEYGIKGAAPLPGEDGFVLVKIPPGGMLKTSSSIEYGVAKDEYYYYVGAKRRRINWTGWGGGGMIWGGHISGPVRSNDPTLPKTDWTAAEGFFVGTEAQSKSYPARPSARTERGTKGSPPSAPTGRAVKDQ